MPGRSGFIASAAFHLVLVALIFFGLPHFLEDKIPEETPIAVELVNIAPETHATKVTQAPPVPKAKPEEVAQAEPTPPEPPKPVPPPPEPPKPAPPEPKPRPPAPPPPPTPPPPVPPPPEPKPMPKPPEPKPEPPKPEPPKPAPPKPDPKPVPKPKPPDDAGFDTLLKDLTKRQVASNEPAPPDKAKPSPQPQRQASSRPIAPLAAQLSTSEMDVVTQQLEACWNVPVGARNAPDLRPEFRVAMNQDGTVRSAELLNSDRLGDPFFQAAADSARRAFQAPKCQPLKLPPDKYDQWRTFTITFDPKDIQ